MTHDLGINVHSSKVEGVAVQDLCGWYDGRSVPIWFLGNQN
ncbi:MAG: hypothetical protein ACO2ZM_07870 [Francisellaceae bacterium]